jgi:excisionase family DNA binding protein
MPVVVLYPYVAALLERAMSGREWRTHLMQLEQTNPRLARELRTAREQMRYSAWWYRDQVSGRRGDVSDDRNAEVDLAEADARSERPLLDTASVGRVLGCTSRRVIQLIDGKHLRAHRLGRVWGIEPESVDEYLMRSST